MREIIRSSENLLLEVKKTENGQLQGARAAVPKHISAWGLGDLGSGDLAAHRITGFEDIAQKNFLPLLSGDIYGESSLHGCHWVSREPCRPVCFEASRPVCFESSRSERCPTLSDPHARHVKYNKFIK